MVMLEIISAKSKILVTIYMSKTEILLILGLFMDFRDVILKKILDLLLKPPKVLFSASFEHTYIFVSHLVIEIFHFRQFH